MAVQIPCVVFSLVLILNTLAGIGNAHVERIATTRDENATVPTVTIPQGTLQGKILLSRYNRSIYTFQGIPYAEPPIGDLRFSSPVAANAWNGTLDATVEGSWCPQTGYVTDEDCLYLNVYALQLPENNDTSLLPVMVFIHGGGFESGTGGAGLCGPDYLLDADVVLVAMNYRLGPLGFLSTGDEVAPGNWGLKDQVLALQWVQENIAYFGGDPGQVTIFGQSAGGACVHLLTLSETTVGLFHKFISQSGAAYAFGMHIPRATSASNALILGEALGCPTNTSTLLVDCLRQLNVSEIIDTGSQLADYGTYSVTTWGPTEEPDIEGAFLTDTPLNLMAAGKIRDVPSMAGITKDEGVMSIPGTLPDSEGFQELINDFDNLLPIVYQYSDRVDDVSSFTAALKEFYFNNDLTTNLTEVWSNCVDLGTDTTFAYPVYRALEYQLAFAQNASFLYSFEYRGGQSYSDTSDPNGTILGDRVLHGDDCLYLFPEQIWWSGTLYEGMSETDLVMIDTMVQLWTSFAINGTPTTTATISNVTWLPYSSETNYLRIGSGLDPALELQYNFLQERMQFWEKLTATGSGNTPLVSPFLKLIFVLLIAFRQIISLAARIL